MQMNEERLKKAMEHKELLLDRKPSLESVMKKPGLFDSAVLGNTAVSQKCQSDFQLMLLAAQSIITKKPIAGWDTSFIISQLDACGKPGPGILQGNFQWMGAYQECININAPPPPSNTRNYPYQGGYCRAAFAINPSIMGRKKRSTPHTEAACTSALKGGAGVTLSEDICLPKGCANDQDATVILRYVTGGDNSSVCHVACIDPEANKLSWRGFVVAVVMCITLAVVLIGTVIDYCWYQNNKDHHLAKAVPIRMLLAFSFYTNTVEIMAAKNRPGAIGAIHCIRVFSMVWVIAGHVFMVALEVSNNPFDAVPIIKDLMTQVIVNAFFSVDSFFFLSGLLLSFMWFKELKKNRKAVMSPSAWVMFYVHRIIRLSPPYYMIIAFYTWVFPYFLKQSPLFVGASDLLIGSCPDNWWINFLYLLNIIDYKNQCYPIAWYLATDMQIHIFAPIVLIPLAISPLIGFAVSALLMVLSAAASMFTIYYFHMPPSAFLSPYGAKDLEYTVDPSYYTFYVYDAPWIRFPVYLMGILLGYYLQNNKRKVTIPKVVNIVGWALSLAMMLLVVFGLHDYMGGTDIDIFWRAMYTAFSRTVWGLCLAWIVYSCYYGYGGPFNRFLSWNIWIPLGRLTYCAYLLHMTVALYIMSTQKQAVHWSGVIDLIIHQLIPTIVFSYIGAIIWSSAYEISTSKIEMIFLGDLRKRPHREVQETNAPKKDDNFNGTYVIESDKNGTKF
uniref:Nose resistant-to-fluoxetine protein N-terminal domain-containing protein n=1 Tax=Plectus sambesii TaxID=2011161 RepID=A0A914WB17_9BILA